MPLDATVASARVPRGGAGLSGLKFNCKSVILNVHVMMSRVKDSYLLSVQD